MVDLETMLFRCIFIKKIPKARETVPLRNSAESFRRLFTLRKYVKS
jgi:hypothetical protein